MEKISIAALRTEIKKQATMSINGVPQNFVDVKTRVIDCANCKRVLAQFNGQEPLTAVVDAINTELAKNIIYCPTCGCKLNYTATIIDSKQEETTNEA